MPPVQTTYLLEHDEAVAGALVDAQLHNIRSGVAEIAIPFGRLVSRGTAAGTCKLPTTAGEVTATGMGVAVRVQSNVGDSSDVLQYEDERNVSFIDFGVVYVLLDENVTAGAAAYARYAAGGQGRGTFGSTAGTSERAVLTGCSFLKAGSAGEIVPLRVRMIAGA